MTLCRLDVFANETIKKRNKTITRHVAWQDWNDDKYIAKLCGRPGYGSFNYKSPRDAYRRATVLIRRGASQVKVMNNQSVEIARLWAKGQ